MRSFLYHTIPRHYIYTSQPKYYDKIDVYYQPLFELKSTLLSARKGHPEWWGMDIQLRNEKDIVFTNPWRNHHEWWGY
jgi:hypothetical protein